MRNALYAIGAPVEALGIFAIATPDFVPGLTRFSEWLSPRLRRVENRLRRLIGMKARAHVVSASGIASVAMVGAASAFVSIAPDATLEEKVEFLLRRNAEGQSALNSLSERFQAIEREAPQRLDELRDELKQHVRVQIDEAEASFRVARVLGTIAVAIGLTLATIANFLPQ